MYCLSSFISHHSLSFFDCHHKYFGYLRFASLFTVSQQINYRHPLSQSTLYFSSLLASLILRHSKSMSSFSTFTSPDYSFSVPAPFVAYSAPVLISLKELTTHFDDQSIFILQFLPCGDDMAPDTPTNNDNSNHCTRTYVLPCIFNDTDTLG
ncbi:unnamed protein product [Acanthosepion pharaonis]|uniref:Uncharacterized protein n=1 Tax=Acanthosepion pharaonis TaxID=158019 RepID=A0A812B8G8_ACAPH|nr:unnamed protein product [Sepia pharaonis]